MNISSNFLDDLEDLDKSVDEHISEDEVREGQQGQLAGH